MFRSNLESPISVCTWRKPMCRHRVWLRLKLGTFLAGVVFMASSSWYNDLERERLKLPLEYCCYCWAGWSPSLSPSLRAWVCRHSPAAPYTNQLFFLLQWHVEACDVMRNVHFHVYAAKRSALMITRWRRPRGEEMEMKLSLLYWYI